MRILITGGSGMLGQALLRSPVLAREELMAPPRNELDVTDAGAANRWLARNEPQVVVHCAAIVRSRGAEEPHMKELTSRVNVYGTGCVARAAAEIGARMVYVSTDFVFGGDRPGGEYREDDIPCPMGYYAMSKLAGEHVALRNECSLVVRMSFAPDDRWPYPKAFTDRFTSKRRVSRAARSLALAAKSPLCGVVHQGDPRRSYFELARELDPNVEPMTMDELPEGAGRVPVDTSLDCGRWRDYCHRSGIDD